MSSKNLKVLYVTAEATPFATVGGLAQVAYFLPKALKKIGADVAVFMPKYGIIDEKKWKMSMLKEGLRVPTGEKQGTRELICNVKVRRGTKREPTVYFLENQEYFEKRANVYGYADDHTRFALLSRGVWEFLRATGLRPNIVHCNDWHTGYVPDFLHSHYEDESELRAVTTVFTIHNLKNQGSFDFQFASPMDFDDGKSRLASFFSDRLRKQNALKRGIIYSDLVNTVSETYAKEIMTAQYGEGLHELMKELRTKVFGVLNGLDYTDFDPATDHVIKKNFSWRTLGSRKENKIDLQREFHLDAEPDAPILAYVGRLVDQKGVDLIAEILPTLLAEFQAQCVIMGTGDQKYREFFNTLEKKYPGRVGTHLMANFTLPRKIFAGADLLLLPSRFEPAGIVVVEAMRYGVVPIVRATGGLADIVEDVNTDKRTGHGFTFRQFSPLAFYGSIVRALQQYQNKKRWEWLVSRVMRQDFSWDHVAKLYLDLYARAIEFRRDRQSPVVKIPGAVQ